MKRILSMLTLLVYSTQLAVSCGYSLDEPTVSRSRVMAHARLTGDEELPTPGDALVRSELDGAGFVFGSTPGSFSVTQDGAAAYSVPLWVPAGRAGVQPSLSLEYNSRGGNGLLGVGWGLSGLSQITRCNKTFAQDGAPGPVRFDSTDALCLDGKRLVQVGTTSAGEKSYTTEREEFSRIVAKGEDLKGPQWFEVQLKNGLVLEYGKDGASRVEGFRMHFLASSSHPLDATVVGDHTSEFVRYGWSLSRVTDRKGNYMTVLYQLLVTGDSVNGHAYEQLPVAMHYTGSTTDSSVATPQRQVRFKYPEGGQERPDRGERFVSGLKLRTAHRLEAIEMRGPGEWGWGGTLLRTYRFTYRNDSISGRSLMETLQECDANGDCKRPTTFTWELGSPWSGREVLPSGGDAFYQRVVVSEATPYIMGSGGYPDAEGFRSAPDFWTLQTLDINGDGRDDIVYRFSPLVSGRLRPPKWYARLNTNGRDFGPAFQLPSLPEARTGDGADDLRTVDLDNDGRVDVVGLFLTDTSQGIDGHYEFLRSNGTGFDSAQSDTFDFWYDLDQPVRAPGVHIADLDGNGLPDVARSLTPGGGSSLPYEWGVRLTQVDSGGAPVFPATHARTGVGAGLDHAGYSVDVDGDGAMELLVRAPESGSLDQFSRFLVPLGLTAPGVIGRKPTTTLSTLPVHNNANEAIYRHHWFMDINGDGLPDSVSAKNQPQAHESGSLEISINTGNGFSPPVTKTLPPGAEVSFSRQHTADRLIDVGVRVMDFNMDGKQDLLLTDSGFGVSTRAKQVVLQSTGTDFVVRTLGVNVGQSTGSGNEVFPSEDDHSNLSYKGSGWGMKLTQLLDANGDGLTDIIQMENGQLVLYLRNSYKPDLLKYVKDGLDNQFSPVYEATTFASPTTVANHHTPATCTALQSCNMRAQWLVTYHVEQAREGSSRGFTHTYSGGRTDLRGRGWLGFASRTVQDHAAATLVTTRYHNDRRSADGFYLEAHQPYEQVTEVTLTGGQVDTFRRALEYASTSKAGGKVVFPYLWKSTESEVDGQAGEVRRQVSTNTYDAYGNLTRHEEVAKDGTRMVTSSLFDNFPNGEKALLGLLREQTVTSTTPGGQSASRTKSYEYCDGSACVPTSNLPRRVIVEPGATSPEREDMWLESVFTYNDSGLVTHVESTDLGGRKRQTTLRYDSFERLLLASRTSYTTGSLSGPSLRTDYAYHRGLDVPTLQQSPNGVQTRWYYDGFGRPRAEDGPDSGDLTVGYGGQYGRPLVTIRQVDVATCGSNAFGRDFSTCTRNGTEAQVHYDSMGREIQRRSRGFDGTWVQGETTYDSLGRVEFITLPHAELGPELKQRFEYDQRGRLRFVRNPDGSYRETRYQGLKTLEWDEKRNHGYTLEDGLGRVVRSVNVTSTGDIGTSYEYGPFNLPRLITDASGNQTVMEYDRLGRRTLLDDPDSGIRRTWYTAYGDVRAQTDGNGNTLGHDYDGLGRLVTVTNQPMSGPAEVSSFVWDTAVNGEGSLHSATSPDGVVQTYEYDTLGRPVHQRWSIQGQEYRLSTTYDAQGRVQTLGYPEVAGRSRMGVVYNYTAYGQLQSLQNINTGHAYWTATSRNASGMLTGELFGNGVSSTRRYDALNQLRFIDTAGPAGAVQQLAYDYESNGNLRSRIDRVQQVTEDFQYDGLNRLKQWKVSKGCNNALFQYGYDVLGNLNYRSSKLGTASNAPFQEAIYAYGAGTAGPHAVTSVGADHYAYDGNGNLNRRQEGTGGLRELQYTYFNLPKRVTEGTREWTFGYDANHRRAFKQGDGHTTTYVGEVYEKRTKPDSTTSHLFYIQAPEGVVAQVEWTDVPTPGAESVAYLHTDHLGSVESVTSSGGVVLAHQKYDPFGLRKDAANPAMAYGGGAADPRLGFTGHEEDDDLGLINMKGRMYDPKLGRFLSPDPIVQAPFFGQSLNRYTYVLNNPLSFTDPTGFQSEGLPTTEFEEDAFEPTVIVAGQKESHLTPSTSPMTLTVESSVFEPGEYEFVVSGGGVAVDPGAADPNGSRVSGLEAGAYGAAGLIAGFGMGLGAAYALGVLSSFCVPCAVGVGIGSLALGAYQLAAGGAEALWDSGKRMYDGRGTASDWFGAGAMVGGLFSGRFAKGTTLMGHEHGLKAGGAIRSTLFSTEGTATILSHEGNHASIIIKHGLKTLHTEQLVLEGNQTTIDLVLSAEPVLESVTVRLPDASAAMRYQQSLLKTPTGLYNRFTNSCVTHCGDVLRAGGLEDVPTKTLAIIRWLRTQQ